jgi:hypothetical protein
MSTSEKEIETGQQQTYQQLVNLIGYRWKWAALVEAVRLNIASLLENGPLTIEEIATACQAQPLSVYYLLQFLAYSRIFEEVSPGRFAQTELSNYLRADVPGSVYNLLLMQGSPWLTHSWEQLGYSLRTGEPAFPHVHHEGIWQYLDEHPSEKRIFDHVMDDVSRVFTPQIVEAYDFGSAETVIDIGGGRGALLEEILRQNAHLHGIVFDMPATVEDASSSIAQRQAGKCTTQSGNFFETIPSGGDVYLLKQILHDWNDEQALTILRTCRKAMSETSRLLIIEMFPRPVGQTPPEGFPPFIGFLQLQMMVLFGGKERNEQDFKALLEQADLQLTQVIHTRSPYRLLECSPAHL